MLEDKVVVVLSSGNTTLVAMHILPTHPIMVTADFTRAMGDIMVAPSTI